MFQSACPTLKTLSIEGGCCAQKYIDFLAFRFNDASRKLVSMDEVKMWKEGHVKLPA